MALHAPTPPRSLRRRLLLRVSLASLLIWVLAAALSYRQASHEVRELMDSQMVKTARLLLVQTRGGTYDIAGLAESMAVLRGLGKPSSRRGEMPLEFQISRADGTLLSRSRHAPPTPPAELGFTNIEYGGQAWHSLTLETEDGIYRVQVTQSGRLRNREALEMATKTVLPLGLLFPLLIGLIYFSVWRGLKPLDDLAAEVAARSPDNLAALAPVAEPLETQPLVAALNHLLGRLAATLDNERRFTADAAHELRTPLAALKIQAQVAMATKNPEQSRHALAQVLAGADRTTHLIEQLLRLARLDPIDRLPEPQLVDLSALANAAAEAARNTATGRQQSLLVSLPECPVAVSGDHDLLATALRNLVSNALRYTPEQGSIAISAGMENGETLLAVTDNGPGVPAEELPRLIERFYRGREAGAEGSGLGLAIVQRIAELHGAQLEVNNLDSGGFSARLRWPAPQMIARVVDANV
jgi:two-component system, OmpR family, sensor histidine kinase QseC